MNVFELMIEYIKEGRIKIDRSKFQGKLATVHDPCNYVRKSEKTFSKGYGDEIRWITGQICTDWVDTFPSGNNNYCCGAGGGAWAMPYSEERIFYGRKKAEQIKESKAEIVVAPCHNCRDQIMKSLTKEYDLDIETFYLWELLSEAIIVEPWSEEEIEKSRAEAAAQWEKLGVELDDEDDWEPPE
jgi:Fe-S oxidoreductase